MSAEPINLVLGTARLKREWHGLSPLLQEIALYVALRRKQMHKVDSRVTSIYRTPEENAAVGAKSQTHVQWRAIDLSVKNSKNLILDDQLRREVNVRWPVIGADMPRIPDINHGTGPHLHIQESVAEHAKEVHDGS